ncbi:MAG: HPr family phosphocarrier protein [Candidatus Competibacteraceae bacterium]
MLKQDVTITNKLGLRPSNSEIGYACYTLCADMQICQDGHEVNSKSIMGVMMLAASPGTQLELWATGEDAEQALDSLETLIQQRFGEDG